jgi:hypothetical protein
MMNPRKPASPFGEMAGAQNKGQYGANASPKGNAWGQQFMQQFGAPPGQMRDEWSQFRQDNGIGGGMGGMGGQPSPVAPQMPQQMQQQNPMSSWLQQRPQMGGGQGGDRMQMLRAWLAQRNRGLLGQ